MKKIVITAGGTSEKIDNVRKITNSSTGKLGSLIAEKLLKEIKDIGIYYICSKDAIKPKESRIKIIEIEDTFALEKAVTNILTSNNIDYFIHAMAVSDYTKDYVTTIERIKESITKHTNLDKAFENIEKISKNKISSYENNLVIVLKQTPKIISLIKKLSPKTYLVGFKLLDGVSKDELIDVATKLRDKNNCDLVVANDLESIKNGKHTAYIIDKKDNIEIAKGKESIASKIVKQIINK